MRPLQALATFIYKVPLKQMCICRFVALHIFPKWLSGSGSAEGWFQACKYSILSGFLFSAYLLWALKKQSLGWRISLSRSTYLISVLPALLFLRFIDQDDCICCPLPGQPGRGKGSFAEKWVLRAGLCLWMHSRLASLLWCPVIKIIKWGKWPLC